MFLIYLMVVFSSMQLVYAQTCSCDLVSNVCNLNCCCDGLCTEDDKLSFSRCDPINQNRIERVCVSDSILYSTNGKYQAEGNGAGLFCIYKDNYEARHFYSTETSVNSLADFEQLLRKYGTSSYAVTPKVTPTYENSLKVGDPLFVLFTDNQQGFISLPIPFTNGICQDSNPAGFQMNNNTKCSRLIQTLPTQCSLEESWNAQTYASGFKVAPYPSFIFGETRFLEISNASVSNANTSVEIVSVNDTQLLEPTLTLPLRCKDDAGIITDCPFTTIPTPSYDAVSETCNDVVSEIHYSMNFSSNGTTELDSIEVAFVFVNIKSGLQSFSQSFSTVFQEKTIGNITNTTVIERSGNPGYIHGLPVVTGNSFVDINDVTKVAVNQDSTTWLSTVRATNNGLCDINAVRTLVGFGVDYRSGCLLSVKTLMTLAECESLQSNIFSLLLKDLPTHIATFGNSNGEMVEEWIAVMNDRPTHQIGVSNGQCGNVITNVLFEVLYTKTGFFSNPQRKIVGFRVRYGTPQNLLLQCNGITCPPSFNIEITHSVSFTDVSSTPQTEVKPKPKFKSKAPHDFFYPFL